MTVDPESGQLKSLWHGRDKEALPLRSRQTEKQDTHHDSVTDMPSKMVTEAGGPPPLHAGAGLVLRSQAEASDTLANESLQDLAQGVMQTLTVAAGTGLQTPTRSALTGTDQTDHLEAGMMTATVTMTADALARNMCMSQQRGINVMTEQAMTKKEAHATRTRSCCLTQGMISVMCQEAAGRAVAAHQITLCMLHPAVLSAETWQYVWDNVDLTFGVRLILRTLLTMLLMCKQPKQRLKESSNLRTIVLKSYSQEFVANEFAAL